MHLTFPFELHRAALPAHPFPLHRIAVTIPFIEEGQTLLACLFAPVTALDLLWSLIYNRLFLVFHPVFFFGRQSSLSLFSYFVMMELAILIPFPYLSIFLLVSVNVERSTAVASS